MSPLKPRAVVITKQVSSVCSFSLCSWFWGKNGNTICGTYPLPRPNSIEPRMYGKNSSTLLTRLLPQTEAKVKLSEFFILLTNQLTKAPPCYLLLPTCMHTVGRNRSENTLEELTYLLGPLSMCIICIAHVSLHPGESTDKVSNQLCVMHGGSSEWVSE